jgi:ketosteroid isomerase-like protein
VSQENVEIVRRGIEAANRRPKPDFATINDLYHPDHEFISRLDALEGKKRRGARGYRDWLRNLDDAIEFEQTLEGVSEIGEDRVLAIARQRMRGKSSGVPLSEERIGVVVTVRDGKIVRSEVYDSPEEALKAVGVEE